MDERTKKALDWEIRTAERELKELNAAHADTVAKYEKRSGVLMQMIAAKRAMRGDPVEAIGTALAASVTPSEGDAIPHAVWSDLDALREHMRKRGMFVPPKIKLETLQAKARDFLAGNVAQQAM